MSSLSLSFNNVDLVTINGGELFTTSTAIADGTGNTHDAVLQLLKRHANRFNRTQRVRFEIEPFDTAGGIQSRTIAMLDERQAYLLMTMLRNTERVMDFKEALIDAFLEARNILNGNIGSLVQRFNTKSGILKKGEAIASDCGYHLRLYGQVINPKTRDELKEIESQLQPLLTNFDTIAPNQSRNIEP